MPTHDKALTASRRDQPRTGRHAGMQNGRGVFENLAAVVLEIDWLPDMDLNHDKQIQSLLCYRYTIGQSVGA